MRIAVVAALLLSLAPEKAVANDVENAFTLGEMGRLSGIATDYDVSGWHRRLDVYISSVLPGDAREVAEALCQVGTDRFEWERPWEVRVFLVVGERPAATCSAE